MRIDSLARWLAVLVVVGLTAMAPMQSDSWWHLRTGAEIVLRGEIPRTDMLSYAAEGRPWPNHEWLAQVVFYAAHGLAGMRAVILLDVALVVLALGLAIATARTSGASSRSVFAIGLLAVLAGPWGWTIRAQSAALPLYAGTPWFLPIVGAWYRARDRFDRMAA